MNRQQLLLILLAILLPAFLVSCDDDDDDVSPNISLLTAGEWTGNAIYEDGEDITDEVLELGFDVTKYTLKFNRDGKYQDRYPGQSLPGGTWVFENNERVIVFDKGTDDEYTVVVSKLDKDELTYIDSGFEFRFVR